MKKILIVEDELDIQEILDTYLRNEGYKTVVASDGVEALSTFQSEDFDLILLDIMLPKIDGYGVCEVIRKSSNVPIVMLTALGSEQEQIYGFDFEIDDYITKPFSIPILLKKINAILRRNAKEIIEENILRYKDIILNFDSLEVEIMGEKVDLTNREFNLLCELIKNRGKVLTREILLARLWEYDFFGDDRIVDTHIKNLRKKLGVDYIETVRGVGYFVAKEDS